MTANAPLLMVFGGLPGTGKTTLARKVAARRRMTYLRIDSIEQAMRSAGVLAGEVGPAGYLAAYDLARDNLKIGHSVVVDCVNPLPVTRTAWREVSQSSASPIMEIEVICSNVEEHRRRVETRLSDIPGRVPPTWALVLAHHYELWTEPRLVIDTATLKIEEAIGRICTRAEAEGRNS